MSSALVELFGPSLVSADGSKIDTSTALADKKFVLVYFSAHWCPPCRNFTPVLAKKYSAAGKPDDVEIVFVSSDQDEASFNQYFGGMPWLALPFNDRDKKASLSDKYGVRGIPCLVVLDGEGNVVTKEGRGKESEWLGGGGGGGGGGADNAKRSCTIL